KLQRRFVIAEQIIDGANPRGPRFEASQALDRRAVHFCKAASRHEAAGGRALGLDICRQIFPTQARRKREAIEAPGIHAVDSKVRLQPRLVDCRRVVRRDVEWDAVSEPIKSVSIRNVVDVVRTKAVLDSKLERVRTRRIRSRSVQDVAIPYVVTFDGA